MAEYWRDRYELSEEAHLLRELSTQIRAVTQRSAIYEHVIKEFLKICGETRMDARSGQDRASCLEMMEELPGLVFVHNDEELKLDE